LGKSHINNDSFQQVPVKEIFDLKSQAAYKGVGSNSNQFCLEGNESLDTKQVDYLLAIDHACG